MRRCVVIESPFAGDRNSNRRYLIAAVTDCLQRGEAPLASHAFYTQFLDDDVPSERELGIECGLAWQAKAELVAVYADLGISPGMLKGIEAARLKVPIEIRHLSGLKLRART